MWRYLVGLAAGVLLVAGGVLWWRNTAVAERALPPAPAASVATTDSSETPPEPPVATEKTREERRFGRYDRDKDGQVDRDEYLAARRKAFAKLDLNGDGTLSFDEYAAKTLGKFKVADADKSGVLVPAEFATTRVCARRRVHRAARSRAMTKADGCAWHVRNRGQPRPPSDCARQDRVIRPCGIRPRPYMDLSRGDRRGAAFRG